MPGYKVVLRILLIKEQNVKECDATGGAICTKVGFQLFLFIHVSIKAF